MWPPPQRFMTEMLWPPLRSLLSFPHCFSAVTLCSLLMLLRGECQWAITVLAGAKAWTKSSYLFLISPKTASAESGTFDKISQRRPAWQASHNTGGDGLWGSSHYCSLSRCWDTEHNRILEHRPSSLRWPDSILISDLLKHERIYAFTNGP